MPDDPDGRRACWHHKEPEGCAALGLKLENDRETRRMTSIGLDVLVWAHVRKRLQQVPQRPFLERFETSRRWEDGATPPLGLARGAVLYHLPVAGESQTPAEMFEESLFRARICASEREWLEAERRARFSYFEVVRANRLGVQLRDWFGELSGRRDVLLRPEEIDETLAAGQTVFARIVPYRNDHYVDLLQCQTSAHCGIADPGAPARAVWGSDRALRDRSGMVYALFETWEREKASARVQP